MITNTHKFDLRHDYNLFYLPAFPDSKDFMNRAFCHVATSKESAGMWSLAEKVTVLPLQGYLLGDCSYVFISPFRFVLLRFIPYFYKSLCDSLLSKLRSQHKPTEIPSSPSSLVVVSDLLVEGLKSSLVACCPGSHSCNTKGYPGLLETAHTIPLSVANLSNGSKVRSEVLRTINFFTLFPAPHPLTCMLMPAFISRPTGFLRMQLCQLCPPLIYCYREDIKM